LTRMMQLAGSTSLLRRQRSQAARQPTDAGWQEQPCAADE
jgi:hypothetical protein